MNINEPTPWDDNTSIRDFINHAHISCVEAPLHNLGFIAGPHDIWMLAVFAQHGTDKQRAVLLRHRQDLIDHADRLEAEPKQLREEVIAKLTQQ